jgi:putative transposase
MERVSASPRLLVSVEVEPDILAFYAFPPSHWRKLRSTNALERFNREVGRRTDVVGIFPDDRSLIRLAGTLCIEQTMSGWSAAATSPRSRSLSSSAPRRSPL